MSLLSVARLSASHAGRQVLFDVDLEVEARQLWVVLGPNGAGKSTLLRTAIGLHEPSAGERRLSGRPLQALSRTDVAQKVAFVPQEHEADAGFSALELVMMGRAPHQGFFAVPTEADVARAREALSKMGLLALASRPESALSGGERRLVLLARAFCQAPQLMVLDEPTAFLDLRHQVETLRLVRQAVDGGLGALTVLHDANLAASFATHVMLLRDGRVVSAGPVASTLSGPALSALFGVAVREAVTANGDSLYAPSPS